MYPRANFNPRSPWGERLGHGPAGVAPLHFNPRSPWGERLKKAKLTRKIQRFQSTLPVGGATFGTILGTLSMPIFQSTLPVGGATRPYTP